MRRGTTVTVIVFIWKIYLQILQIFLLSNQWEVQKPDCIGFSLSPLNQLSELFERKLFLLLWNWEVLFIINAQRPPFAVSPCTSYWRDYILASLGPCLKANSKLWSFEPVVFENLSKQYDIRMAHPSLGYVFVCRISAVRSDCREMSLTGRSDTWRPWNFLTLEVHL